MRTLSDLVGAASEDEQLKEAFQAQARQSVILSALVTARDKRKEELKKAFQAQALQSAILAAVTARDTREEAYCHHPRKPERQPVRPKPRHTVFISAFAVAVLALGFGGGYVLLTDALTEPNEGAKVAEATPRGPPTIAAAQPPAPTGATEQEEPPGKLAGASIAPVLSTAADAAERGDVAGNAENARVPSLPGSDVAVAKVTADTGAAIDQSDVMTSTDELEKSATVEPPDQHRRPTPSARPSVNFSLREGDVPKSSPPDAAVSDRAYHETARGTQTPNMSAQSKPVMASAKAVTCQTSGPAGDGHWAWRLIDGRKCWYKGAAGMDKSLLHWPPLEQVPELQ